MAYIVYQTNKKTGAKYAYESVSYWDKDKGQPRSKRRYLGRVDPQTNEIIKTGKKAQGAESAAQPEAGLEKLHEEIAEKDRIIGKLREELAAEKKRSGKLAETLHKIHMLSGEEL